MQFALINPQGIIVNLSGGRKIVTTAGVPVQLSSIEIACSAIQIQALPTNTGYIAVGGSDVNAAVGYENGIQLVAGQVELIPTNNMQTIWLDSTVNLEGICYTIMKG